MATAGSIWLTVAIVAAFNTPDLGAFSTIAFDQRVIGFTLIPTTLVIGITSLVKMGQLSGGGATIAKLLGGVEVDPSTSHPAEQRLLNVVQEMAIASGSPIPKVFVIQSDAINAFAAGDTPEDAVIGITTKAIDAFDRDELQGVIAHEYSHIFHGDMVMNKRLTGAIAGIVALGVMGWICLRYIAPVLMRSGGSGKNKSNGAMIGLAVMLLGLLLMVAGFFGTLFGQLIQAAVSRQREFLADASAVQYTRNPNGIANALRKIGGWRKTTIEDPKVAAFGHYFFCSAVDSMHSTHPPLDERIRRIENLRVSTEVGAGGVEGTTGAALAAAVAPTAVKKRRHNVAAPMPMMASTASLAGTISRAGSIDSQSLVWAGTVITSLGDRIRTVANTADGARAVIYALSLSNAEDIDWIDAADPAAAVIVREIMSDVRSIPRRNRLVLVDLCVPSLLRVPEATYRPFRKAIAKLVRKDGKVSLSEWSMINTLRFRVERVLWALPEPKLIPLLALRSHAVSYLGILALTAHDPSGAAHALSQGLQQLSIGGGGLPTKDAATLDILAKNVEQLHSLSTHDRGLMLRAAVAVVAADDACDDDEYEIVRALCDAIGAPLPPLPGVS